MEVAEEYVVAFDTDSSQQKEFILNISTTGRYRLSFYGNGSQVESLWLEDYIDNKDERTYDVSGSLMLSSKGFASVDGSPLAKGLHKMRLHLNKGIQIDSMMLELIQENNSTSKVYTQSMKGEKWDLVWSDEFEGEGLVDSSKWSYNIGNWGWGNKELQYYTLADTMNARQENGNLIVEAIKDENGNWSSARLTTQGKAAFTYGKIEFKAKVPVKRGVWSAGWLLGDKYADEISWPYCGEIDVLECVGYEIDDESGDGINHATCHTPKYYFKKGNQIGSEIKVENMNEEFHVYGIEWDSTEIRAYLDGDHYYTYDKSQDELEWPFHQAQNIIINLAIGGGWGGAKGIDSSFQSQQYILDYVRVYQKL